MFDKKKTLGMRLADTADLIIDFATLGEYGLEPVRRPASACERRRHGGPPMSRGSWASAIDRFATQA